ncbi:2861_t:CDS:2, partial [Funneliformis mosseae]
EDVSRWPGNDLDVVCLKSIDNSAYVTREFFQEASDVYSFGIIMMEVITGFPPFYDFPHDENLAISICEGLRPTIGRRIPQLLSNLIDQCLDADPTKRLSSEQLKNTLGQYYKDV